MFCVLEKDSYPFSLAVMYKKSRSVVLCTNSTQFPALLIIVAMAIVTTLASVLSNKK